MQHFPTVYSPLFSVQFLQAKLHYPDVKYAPLKVLLSSNSVPPLPTEILSGEFTLHKNYPLNPS